ncbi:MAG: TraM recognition domain-containing protein, partial [Acidimicrobiales bacterium]
YIDEAQNFLTLPRSYEEMLAEARGYGLSLVLAHQHLAQLPRELREALSANARNKVMFNCSPEDAHVLARHFEPELGAHDLSHLGAYQAACRLVVSGADAPGFTLRTLPAAPANPRRAAQVRNEARATFGLTDRQRRDLSLQARRPGRRQSAGSPGGQRAGQVLGRPDRLADRPGLNDANRQVVSGFDAEGVTPDS